MLTVPRTNSATLAGGEWAWTETGFDGASLHSLGNVAIDVSVHGNAAAAGLSFGDYKDLLAPLDGERFVQLEIDWHARRWAFQGDARIGARQWWNTKIKSVEDLLDQPLFFKAHYPRGVVFRNLYVRQFESSCRLSVVITCHRFARRLRLCLNSWCHQTVPSGALEIIVVNPGSPDEAHEVVLAAAREYPHVRIKELTTSAAFFRNKGRLINQGVAASCGEWIWLTDADCLFPPDAAAMALTKADSPTSLFYCERRHLTDAATRGLLAQRNGADLDFPELLRQTRPDSNVVPWGYCQLAHRSVFERIRYREDVDSFSNSDIVFVETCAANGVLATPFDGLTCLHLVHPWAWQGTPHLL
jgi:hypothetical protein